MWKCQLLFWKLGRLRWLMMMLIMALTICLISMSLELPGLVSPELFFFRPFADLDLLDEEDEAVRVEQRQILDGKLWNQRWNPHGKAQFLRTQRAKEEGAGSKNMKRKPYERPEWEAWILNHLKRKSRNESVVLDDEKPLKEKPFLQWKGGTSELKMIAQEAWVAGGEAWKAVEAAFSPGNGSFPQRNLQRLLFCPMAISTTGEKVAQEGGLIQIPCGLATGSSITVMATPLAGHFKKRRQQQQVVGLNQTLSHFILELQALSLADSKDPPRLLHVNPRLKGDWSGKPVIEHNTCYRGQWGFGQRCEGWQTADYVDGLIRCEEWSRDGEEQQQPMATSWLNKLLGRPTKTVKLWGFPFATGKFFILTIRAGWHGYHLAVDGRHISSYSYHKDFSLEEATGLYIGGNIDLHAVVITSLPSHPSFSSESDLKISERLKAPPKAKGPISLFIGIVSKAIHFAERMAIRRTWMQSSALKSLRVVARFFVALGSDQDVNVQIKQEADFFGDMVVLTYVDHYKLVVLKTIAICEYGIRNASAKYIMKCDDDTFVSLERILTELKALSHEDALYMGNINQLQKPLRAGKWAVSYEEWPEVVKDSSQMISKAVEEQDKRATKALSIRVRGVQFGDKDDLLKAANSYISSTFSAPADSIVAAWKGKLQPSLIFMRFRDEILRLKVLRKRGCLKGSNQYIDKDLTPIQWSERKRWIAGGKAKHQRVVFRDGRPMFIPFPKNEESDMEWPKDVYPLYADGTGYIITADIAGSVVFQHEKGVLQLFKMEDVSMGLWVSQFAVSKTVNYVNRAKFCQWGCIDGYFTAHYQSPRQMFCLWDKLSRGEANCCNI